MAHSIVKVFSDRRFLFFVPLTVDESYPKDPTILDLDERGMNNNNKNIMQKKPTSLTWMDCPVKCENQILCPCFDKIFMSDDLLDVLDQKRSIQSAFFSAFFWEGGGVSWGFFWGRVVCLCFVCVYVCVFYIILLFIIVCVCVCVSFCSKHLS